MKKLMSILTIFLAIHTVQAQDFDKVKTNLLIGKIENAKTEYDKILVKKANLAGTTEALFWESIIHSVFFKDSVLSKKYPNSYTIIYNNLEKLINNENGNKFINEKAKEKELNSSDPFIQVYSKSYMDGIKYFQENNFKEAANAFNTSVRYSDIFYGRGWLDTKLKLDSNAVFFSAISFEKDNNYNEAIIKFQRLIDSKAMIDLNAVYNDLLICLIQTKDKLVFNKYVVSAKQDCPTNTALWEQFSREFISKTYTIDEKYNLYVKLASGNSLTELDHQFYGELFSEVKMDDPNFDKYNTMSNDAYKKVFEMNPQNMGAAFNIGVGFYNQYLILEDKISTNLKALQNLNASKPPAPKDPRKKAAFDAAFKLQLDSVKKLNLIIDAPIKEKVDGSIEWVTKAFNVIKDKEKLEREEKRVARQSVDILATLYDYKRSKARGKDQKAFDEYDAKFNIYDKLHEKYQ